MDLKLMQRRLSQMLQAVGNALFAVNASREITFCNRAFSEMTGLSADGLLGSPLVSIFENPEHLAVLTLDTLLGEDSLVPGKTRRFQDVPIPLSGDGRFDGELMMTLLELDDEKLFKCSLTCHLFFCAMKYTLRYQPRPHNPFKPGLLFFELCRIISLFKRYHLPKPQAHL